MAAATIICSGSSDRLPRSSSNSRLSSTPSHISESGSSSTPPDFQSVHCSSFQVLFTMSNRSTQRQNLFPARMGDPVFSNVHGESSMHTAIQKNASTSSNHPTPNSTGTPEAFRSPRPAQAPLYCPSSFLPDQVSMCNHWIRLGISPARSRYVFYHQSRAS